MATRVTQQLKEQIHAAALQGVLSNPALLAGNVDVVAMAKNRADAYISGLQAEYDKAAIETKPEED